MTIQTTVLEQYFPVVLFILLYKVVLTFESMGEILKCDHSNNCSRAVLSCGAVCYAYNVYPAWQAIQCGSYFLVRG